MIRVYTAPGSQSCRKVIAWLKEHNLSFIEKNIFSSDLHANESVSYTHLTLPTKA